MQKDNPILIAAINPGFGFTKCFLAEETGDPVFYSMPSATTYPTEQKAQDDQVDLNILTKTQLMFGDDAIRFNRSQAIPRITDDPFSLYFQDGGYQLNDEYLTKLFGPLLYGVYKYFGGKTTFDVILVTCVPDDHRHFKDQITRELNQMFQLALSGRQTIKLNVIRPFVLSETYAGLMSQHLRHIAPGNKIKQNQQYLNEITAVVNAGCNTTDCTVYYPREQKKNGMFIPVLVGDEPNSVRMGNWRLVDSGDIKKYLFHRYPERVTALDPWTLMQIMETKVIPGNPEIDISFDLYALFESRSKSLIRFLEQSMDVSDLHRMLLVGGGMHDYVEFILKAREFQYIPIKEIGSDEAGTTEHPERLVPYGCFTFGRRFYDVAYFDTQERRS